MLNFIKSKEDNRLVRLAIEDDNVEFNVGGYLILTLTSNGELILSSGLPESLGLDIDGNGVLVVHRDS